MSAVAMSAKHRIFVYGTLLRGEYNHRVLGKSRRVCAARTRPAFRLYHLGGFPGMVPEGTVSVTGEVYEVDDRTLIDLDRLEGHPRFYTRVPTTVTSLDADSAEIECETYVLPRHRVHGCDEILDGDWRNARRSY